MNAADVVDALRQHHAKGWVVIPEVTVAAGIGAQMPTELLGAGGQRVDLFAMGTWSSTKYERVAYEIKVSRADLLRELATPRKRAAVEYLSHRFVFATPSGLMRRSELPEGCGLVEVRDNGSVYTFRKGTVRDAPPLPAAAIASLLRTAAEQRTFDRCGARGCQRHGKWLRRPGEVGGMALPFCDAHTTQWDNCRGEDTP